MGQSSPQVSFASGEISPRLYGRIDFQGYQNGLRTCRNFVVQKQGGVQNRAGTHFITEVEDSTQFTRLIPFQFSTDQTYVLELGNQILRVLKNGGLIQRPSVGNVTGVAPAVLSSYPGHPPISYVALTVIGHGLSGGEIITVSGVQSGIDGTWKVYVVDADHFQLLNPYTLGGCTVTVITWVSGGTVALGGIPTAGNLVVPTPWTSADLPLLKFTQNADVLTVVHPNYQPQQISRYSDTNWTVTPFQATNGPFQDLNVDETKTVYVDNASGVVTITASANIFTADMVGMLIYLGQSPDDTTSVWEVQKLVGLNTILKAGPNYYQSLNAAYTGTMQPTATEGTEADGVIGLGWINNSAQPQGVLWQYLHSGFGIVLITDYTSPTSVTGIVQSRIPDRLVAASYVRNITGVTAGDAGTSTPVSVACPSHGFADGDSVTISGVVGIDINGTFTVTVVDANNFTLNNTFTAGAYTSGGTATKTTTAVPSYRWALQAWGSAKQGYPAAVAYYEQREVFGGTPGQPQAIQMSRTAGYLDFGQGVPVLDDDAINATLFSGKVCQIKHFLELSSLIVLTSGGVFVCKGGSDGGGVLTPATIQVRPQSANAVSDVAPLRVDHYGLFVQEKGSQVRSLAYSFAEDSFIGQDMTVTADHLVFNHTIKDWTYQETPNSNVWAVRDDGVLLGLTFVPEQQMVAWHRHDTAGLFESVCCITENNQDTVYFIVNRTINGVQKRYIERMDSRTWASVVDAFFVDCGLTYDGRNASETTMAISGGTLWDNSETLTVTASAAVFTAGNVGDQVVFNSTDDSGNPVTYRFTITAYTSSTVVSAIVNRPLPSAYQNAARTGWALAVRVVSGLDHLDGQTVSILADGMVQAQQVVAAGAVQLFPAAAVVHVGLPITADFETLEIGQAQLRDKKQQINRLSMIVDESASIQAGPDPNHLMLQKPPYPVSYDQGTQLVSEITTMVIPANWSKAARIFVRQDQPLPLSILAVIPEVTAGGS